MRKRLSLIVMVTSFLLLFSGFAGAVILDEPLELEEGMLGITAYMDEAEEDVVGSGIEGEVTIISIGEGEEVVVVEEAAEEESPAANNYTAYIALAGLVILAYFHGKKIQDVSV